MEANNAIAQLTLQDLLTAAAGRDPADVVIKVEELGTLGSGDGVWVAGAVTVDDRGALVIRP